MTAKHSKRFFDVRLFVFVSMRRPDMTFAVDWALSNNYRSIRHDGFVVVVVVVVVVDLV